MIKKIIIAGVAVLIFLPIMGAGIKRAERVECLQWQADASRYQGYYLANWQVEQCKQFK